MVEKFQNEEPISAGGRLFVFEKSLPTIQPLVLGLKMANKIYVGRFALLLLLLVIQGCFSGGLKAGSFVP
jgi:hypothetical protein